MKRLLLIIGIVTLIKIVYAQDVYISENWELIELGESIGINGLYSADIDGNGTEEIITWSFFNSSYFTVLEVTNNQLTVKWSSKLYEPDYFSEMKIKKIRIYNLDNDADQEIFVMLENGMLECYDGATMDMISEDYFGATYVRDFMIDDIDDDLENELIICSVDMYNNNYVKIFSLDNLNLEWSSASIGSDEMEIGDVDNDGVKEIVLRNGSVIDGITKEVDWLYPDGFGLRIELSDINGDLVPDIIGANYNSLQAFDAQNQTELWDFVTNHSGKALLVTDIEEDGIKEIIVESTFFKDGLRCYNAISHELLWQVDNPGTSDGVTSITVGDPDNDMQKEIIWGCGQASTGPDRLCICSAAGGIPEIMDTDIDGYFKFEISVLEDDTSCNLAISSYSTNNNYYGGSVFLYDGIDHDLIWFIDSIFFVSTISCIELAQINESEEEEILIGLSDGYGYNSLIIFDGASQEIIYDNDDLGSIYCLEVADIDNDGVLEIVYGNHESIVYVMNAETFEMEWETAYIWWNGYNVRQLMIENVDPDPALEVIYWVNNDNRIHVYDGYTQKEQAVSEEIEGLTSMDIADINYDGVPEYYLGTEQGEIIVYDGSLNMIISEFSLSDEIIGSLKIANVDFSPDQEIICGGSKLQVFSYNDHDLIWESKQTVNLNFLSRLTQEIRILDIDNDNKMDIFWSNEHGIYQFECDSILFNASPEFLNSGTVLLFPNPVREELKIKLAGNFTGTGTISIFDISGKMLYNNIRTLSQELIINTAFLESGLYIMRVSTIVRTERQKFIKL